jgi:hypothetical protein
MMNGSRIALLGLLLLFASSALASGDDPAWSKPVKGLRARLSVLPPQDTNSPFCRVFFELQNVDRALGQKHVRFSPERLALKVSNTNGTELAPANQPYDGVSPNWETIALPYAGTIRFQISFPGLGYRPAVDKVIVDVGPPRTWIVPQDGSKYFLSGSLSIEIDHPSMDWSGTLELPAVEIPEARTAGQSKL